MPTASAGIERLNQLGKIINPESANVDELERQVSDWRTTANVHKRTRMCLIHQCTITLTSVSTVSSRERALLGAMPIGSRGACDRDEEGGWRSPDAILGDSDSGCHHPA
jgi:hypothetical protein